MNTTAYFDASEVNTPEGLAPSIAMSGITGVPSKGTGLAGAVFAPGSKIWNIGMASEVVATGEPELTFTSSEIAYGAKHSSTTVAEFLDHDASSIVGNGEVDGSDIEMGPSALTLSGFIYIPPGVHQIEVISDDGFSLQIGGVDFSEFEGTRGVDGTARVAEFAGGLYEFDMLYFDASGAMALGVTIDGLPVDQSAYYQSEDDFLNPPPDVPVVPVEDYHPSFFLGEESLEIPIAEATSNAHDFVEGMGDDDVIDGMDGDDHILGGYGDDILLGGAGDDVLDGGRGSDIINGGDGDDLLISRSDAGVQKIGQLAIGMPTRGDPDGEVDEALQKLSVYADQPIVGDDVLIGGAGRDTFLISPQINGKLDIIQEHVKADGSINWAGVAGENNELHDHWVDSFGIDIIADYNREEDHIAVIGHTANVYVDHLDVTGDGIDESLITVISKQHGGGGAHDMDLIGQAIVHGDLVYKEDIQTDANVTYGVVEGYEDVAEALHPYGDEKITNVDGVDYKGYDTRTPTPGANKDTGNGTGTENLGPVTGDPFNAFQNDNFEMDMLQPGAGEADEIELTRDPFEQLGTTDGGTNSMSGTNGANRMAQTEMADPDGLPGALGFWSFDNGVDGAYDDLRGEGGTVKAYTLYENQALLRTDGMTEGPGDTGRGALLFDGEDDFAYLAHDPSMAVTQGTIAMWVRPDNIDDCGMFVTKDHTGAKDGGHFRLGHTHDGGVFLRMAEGDGGSNHSWQSSGGILTEGEWSHLAVSFTETGVTVYADGRAIPDSAWTVKSGDVAKPGTYTEAYLLQNEEPWVFGADQYKTELNETAQIFATDDEDLRNPFEGAIADFGVWGGFTPEDALSADEVAELHQNGPGTALTNPSGPQPMMAIDDTMNGMAGADIMDGGAGDDVMDGGAGNDTMHGGYGDDHLMGGIGNDRLDGGRGSDLLEGGDGNDVLVSRSDAGEQRAGQLVLGEPSRPYPDASIDPDYLKLVDWVDQELVADDVLVGGAGEDHFLFETLINGKKDMLIDNTKDDGRTINWHGVAGENARIHDHWVDSLGIDVIADYDADEDRISVIGHTTNVDVTYATVDTDGDGIDDDAVSIIRAYSQQGNGGGAHDEDNLGYIVVHGDRVEEDDITINPSAHYGVVDTIDEMQEAVAPTGETKWIDLGGGEMHLGYDTRDVDGDPVGENPEAYSSNQWLRDGLVDLKKAVPSDLEAPNVLLSHDGGVFGGGNPPIEIEHDDPQAASEGTWAFSFTAYNPGNDQDQALLSKDHSGYEDGGHLTAYINRYGMLKVRFQGTENERYLYDGDVRVEAGEEYHMAFTFSGDEIALYLNGELVDSDNGYPDGMSGNTEDLVLGASTRVRKGDDDNLQWHFDGEIENLLLLDRPIDEVEAVFLSESGGDIDALNPLYGLPPVATGPEEEETVAPEEAAEDPTEPETPAEEEASSDPEVPADEEDTAADPEVPTEEEPAEEPEVPVQEEEPETSEDPELLVEDETEPEVLPEEDSEVTDGSEGGESSEEEQEEEQAPTTPVVDIPEDEPAAEEEAEQTPPVQQPEDEVEEEQEPETQPEVAEEEPEPEDDGGNGFGELIARFFDMLLSIFGLGGGNSEPASPRVVEDRLDAVDDLLADIIPTYQIDEDEVPGAEEDEEEPVLLL